MQALGLPVSSAQKILDRAQDKSPTFIPEGSVEELVADRPSLPVQWPKLIHRFPLMQNTFAVGVSARVPSDMAAVFHQPSWRLGPALHGRKSLLPCVWFYQVVWCVMQGVRSHTVSVPLCCHPPGDK